MCIIEKIKDYTKLRGSIIIGILPYVIVVASFMHSDSRYFQKADIILTSVRDCFMFTLSCQVTVKTTKLEVVHVYTTTKLHNLLKEKRWLQHNNLISECLTLRLLLIKS